MKNKIVLFDIDHTLFNTATFVDNVYKVHANLLSKEAFYKVMEEVRIGLDQTLEEEGTIKASIVKALWDQVNLASNLYEETPDVLELLSKQSTLGIFSKGDERFQKKKLESILHFFDEKDIHIVSNKYKILPDVINQYNDHEIIIVDDVLDVLYQAKKLSADVFTVFIKRPVYYETYLANQKPIKGFTPDATVTNLREIIPIVSK
ncbi:MAG: HAD family hydrolase [Candidatus Levyibacteriota bacterium]|jgi:FMN phosphatase YigB (HAD superfamily)